MNVLILGANGQLGPHVVEALEGEHTLRLTDVNEAPDTPTSTSGSTLPTWTR